LVGGNDKTVATDKKTKQLCAAFALGHHSLFALIGCRDESACGERKPFDDAVQANGKIRQVTLRAAATDVFAIHAYHIVKEVTTSKWHHRTNYTLVK
jgi:hypothetical protein